MVLPMSTIVSAQIAHFGIFINSSFSPPKQRFGARKQPDLPDKSRRLFRPENPRFQALGLKYSSNQPYYSAIIVQYSVI